MLEKKSKISSFFSYLSFLHIITIIILKKSVKFEKILLYLIITIDILYYNKTNNIYSSKTALFNCWKNYYYYY